MTEPPDWREMATGAAVAVGLFAAVTAMGIAIASYLSTP